MNKRTYPRFIESVGCDNWYDVLLQFSATEHVRVGYFWEADDTKTWNIYNYVSGKESGGFASKNRARLALEDSVCRSLLTLGEFFDVRLREIAKEVQEGGPRMMYKIEAYRSLTFCYVFSKWKYYNTPMYWGPWKTLRCAKRIRAKLNKERCSTVDQFGVTTDHGPAFRTVSIIEVHK